MLPKQWGRHDDSRAHNACRFAVEKDNEELVELLLGDGKNDCDVNYFDPKTRAYDPWRSGNYW